MFSLQTLAALTLGTTMMFEAWGYMLPQQDPTDLLILVNKTNKAPAVPVTLVKPNVQPTRESASENIYMRPEAAAALEALFAGAGGRSGFFDRLRPRQFARACPVFDFTEGKPPLTSCCGTAP